MVEKLPVAVYLDAQVLTGTVSLPRGKRLSDFLNSGIAGQPTSNFLELSEVTISHVDGRKEKAQTAYVNKTGIQLLATLEKDTSRGIGATDGPKPYPFVQKSPSRARMRMPNYELTGSLHCAGGQELQQLLEENMMFLPLTEARIRATDGQLSWNAAFVAVNRGQIHSLRSEEAGISS